MSEFLFSKPSDCSKNFFRPSAKRAAFSASSDEGSKVDAAELAFLWLFLPGAFNDPSADGAAVAGDTLSCAKLTAPNP